MHSNTEFDALFLKLLPRLQRRTVQLVGNRHLGEDLVQEVYVRLRSTPQRQCGLLAHPNPYAYALATAVNLARSGWRAERRWVVQADVDTGRYDAGLEGRQFVADMLQRLSTKEAAVVLLVDLAGSTLEEASVVLGVHKGTAQRNRARALAKLRDHLSVSVASASR